MNLDGISQGLRNGLWIASTRALNTSTRLITFGGALSVSYLAFSLSGCSSSDAPLPPALSLGTGQAMAQAAAGFVQVERLGRPAINEGLVITNAFLNAFNSIPPSLDETDVTAAVRAEVVTVLDALDAADGVDDTTAGAIANAFLPDVMRCDSTIGTGVAGIGMEAYGSTLNALGAPVAGRKLEDDVIDTTFAVLIGTTVIIPTDNVPYARPAAGAGSTNMAIGHDMLEGQAAFGGTATFPFLAAPN